MDALRPGPYIIQLSLAQFEIENSKVNIVRSSNFGVSRDRTKYVLSFGNYFTDLARIFYSLPKALSNNLIS